MTWTLTTSLDEFRSEAGGFLAAHPAENTVLLTIVDRLDRHGLHFFAPEAPRFGWWRQEPAAPVTGAFAHTPPFGPALGRMPEGAATELAGVLHADGPPLDGVRGGRAAVESFGRAWQRATGATATVRVNERLYRLAEPADPDPAPVGKARLATEADRELLITWFLGFMEDINAGVTVDNAELVDRRIAERSLHIWEDDEGRPVSFAGASPVIAGMSRVGPVYTPDELRGRGYASGVVAACTAHVLAQGAQEVLLFTDLSNPTSNSIYQKLGYRPVQDSLVLDLAN